MEILRETRLNLEISRETKLEMEILIDSQIVSLINSQILNDKIFDR